MSLQRDIFSDSSPFTSARYLIRLQFKPCVRQRSRDRSCGNALRHFTASSVSFAPQRLTPITGLPAACSSRVTVPPVSSISRMARASAASSARNVNCPAEPSKKPRAPAYVSQCVERMEKPLARETVGCETNLRTPERNEPPVARLLPVRLGLVRFSPPSGSGVLNTTEFPEKIPRADRLPHFCRLTARSGLPKLKVVCLVR